MYEGFPKLSKLTFISSTTEHSGAVQLHNILNGPVVEVYIWSSEALLPARTLKNKVTIQSFKTFSNRRYNKNKSWHNLFVNYTFECLLIISGFVYPFGLHICCVFPSFLSFIKEDILNFPNKVKHITCIQWFIVCHHHIWKKTFIHIPPVADQVVQMQNLHLLFSMGVHLSMFKLTCSRERDSPIFEPILWTLKNHFSFRNSQSPTKWLPSLI